MWTNQDFAICQVEEGRLGWWQASLIFGLSEFHQSICWLLALHLCIMPGFDNEDDILIVCKRDKLISLRQHMIVQIHAARGWWRLCCETGPSLA
jgi:hypothetical protein